MSKYDDAGFAVGLSIELANEQLVEFARLSTTQWKRWGARLRGSRYRAVLSEWLKAADDPKSPVESPAAYKRATEELTKATPDREVAAWIVSEAANARRLLIEQAVIAGGDFDEVKAEVDRLSREDREDLALHLVNEAVVAVPLLVPLSRHRARAAGRQQTRAIAMAIAQSVVSTTPSGRT